MKSRGEIFHVAAASSLVGIVLATVSLTIAVIALISPAKEPPIPGWTDPTPSLAVTRCLAGAGSVLFTFVSAVCVLLAQPPKAAAKRWRGPRIDGIHVGVMVALAAATFAVMVPNIAEGVSKLGAMPPQPITESPAFGALALPFGLMANMCAMTSGVLLGWWRWKQIEAIEMQEQGTTASLPAH